jgi:hypothetical protein
MCETAAAVPVYTAPIVLPTTVIILKNMITKEEINDDAGIFYSFGFVIIHV